MLDEEILKQHGIRVTAVRLLVWKRIATQTSPFSLNDMEGWMPYMDRSSIFRSLRLFAENHLIHEIDDGSGIQKYCVCRCNNEEHLGHVHFSCTRCGKTFCLDNIHIPVVTLPSQYHPEEVEYIIKGCCPDCKL